MRVFGVAQSCVDGPARKSFESKCHGMEILFGAPFVWVRAQGRFAVGPADIHWSCTRFDVENGVELIGRHRVVEMATAANPMSRKK